MKKVLVTGGAGYIGSHTVNALIDAGVKVVVVDSLETGHWEAVHPDAEFYEGDLRDLKFLGEVFKKEKVDAVIHFAAYSIVGESMKQPLKYYDNNLVGTENLLACMVQFGVKYAVFSSTAATYGEPERIPIEETAATKPTNCYGATKLAMEQMFHWAGVAYGIKSVSLRYFNACGAGPEGRIGEDHHPETHLIPLVLQAASGVREKISVFGSDYPTPDGTCIRDYVHVCDLAQAHILALSYLEKGGASDVFNLGNGKGFSVMEIIKAAEKVTGERINVCLEGRREGDPAQLVASGAKAKKVLGWKPKYTKPADIIKTAWVWHRNNPDGFGGDVDLDAADKVDEMIDKK